MRIPESLRNVSRSFAICETLEKFFTLETYNDSGIRLLFIIFVLSVTNVPMVCYRGLMTTHSIVLRTNSPNVTLIFGYFLLHFFIQQCFE
jgi:hypothetical protein